VAVVDEWDREGYEDIRSIGRCGAGISSIAKWSSEVAEGDKGDASDMMGDYIQTVGSRS
jgi:hypothetical protein